jgi:hypothetical protein
MGGTSSGGGGEAVVGGGTSAGTQEAAEAVGEAAESTQEGGGAGAEGGGSGRSARSSNPGLGFRADASVRSLVGGEGEAGFADGLWHLALEHELKGSGMDAAAGRVIVRAADALDQAVFEPFKEIEGLPEAKLSDVDAVVKRQVSRLVAADRPTKSHFESGMGFRIHNATLAEALPLSPTITNIHQSPDAAIVSSPHPVCQRPADLLCCWPHARQLRSAQSKVSVRKPLIAQ